MLEKSRAVAQKYAGKLVVLSPLALMAKANAAAVSVLDPTAQEQITQAGTDGSQVGKWIFGVLLILFAVKLVRRAL